MHLIRRPGQTLLEMVIAIGVIMVSTLATTGLIVSTITAGRTSQNRVEAANFAREGIEVARAVRDTNYLRRDQNVTECNFNNAGNASPIEWDDTGVTSDGYCPLGSSCSIADPCGIAATPTTSYYIASFVNSPTLARCTICTVGNPESDYFQDQTFIKERTVTISSVPNAKVFVQLAGCSGVNCVSTKFSRVISITKSNEVVSGVGTIEYLTVTSTVKWKERTGTKTLVALERLYNWR